ncbi:hypothetical protein J5N97_022520 [Dioscorea zingiberensis]|uniref:Uncharacterized protein n=1 Tax=Dioscorea zingiberensis TaxID=325984 RepID=A0A9D5CAJ0_9LILI|nr:hypothetical protein J5N97_022520 [Dioscorea zingiberensis]
MRNEDANVGGKLGAISKDGAARDEGLVREMPIGDEDGPTRADAENDDGAKSRVEVMEDGLYVMQGASLQPDEVIDDGDGQWARRETAIILGFEDEEQREDEGESGGDEKPREHDLFF